LHAHKKNSVILSESAVADESKDLHLLFAPFIQHDEGAPVPRFQGPGIATRQNEPKNAHPFFGFDHATLNL
jgi:hypothetical protein